VPLEFEPPPLRIFEAVDPLDEDPELDDEVEGEPVASAGPVEPVAPPLWQPSATAHENQTTRPAITR
jgi:hypothetical protein